MDSSGQRLCLEFNAAARIAREADTLGHKDWALPPSDWHYSSKDQLNVLGKMFDGRNEGAFKGTFSQSQIKRGFFSSPNSWYISSSSGSDYDGRRVIQAFNTNRKTFGAGVKGFVRLVRSVPVKP